MFNYKKFIKFNIINMKLKILVESLEAIKVIANQKLPVTTAYKLSLFLKKVDPELTTWETKKNELIKELGNKQVDEKGKETGNFVVAPEKVKEFTEKIDAILNEKITIVIPEIKLKDLGDLKIEPRYLAGLDWMIKEF
jgi:hypothetical protein